VWTAVLPHLQPIADKDGFGEQWRLMCKERTPDAAAAASDAAAAAANDDAYAATYAANAAAYAAAAPSVAAADFWATVDPIGVLERMTYLTGAKP